MEGKKKQYNAMKARAESQVLNKMIKRQMFEQFGCLMRLFSYLVTDPLPEITAFSSVFF